MTEEEAMTQTVAECMTPSPTTIEATRSVRDVAELMASGDVGAVVVVENSEVTGIVTDRDLVVRVLATGGSAEDVVRQVVSGTLVTVKPDDSAEQAAQVMRDNAVRRVPVMQAGELVGIVALGDLAIERDPRSALADISAEEPNT